MRDKSFFCIILTSTYIILKTFNVINWSWIWVLSPLWIKAIQILVVAMALGIVQLYRGEE